MNKKLTPHERRAIKRLLNNGIRGVDLAAAFGVTPQCISQIKKGSWDSVHGASRVRGVVTPLSRNWRNIAWSHA